MYFTDLMRPLVSASDERHTRAASSAFGAAKSKSFRARRPFANGVLYDEKDVSREDRVVGVGCVVHIRNQLWHVLDVQEGKDSARGYVELG